MTTSIATRISEEAPKRSSGISPADVEKAVEAAYGALNTSRGCTVEMRNETEAVLHKKHQSDHRNWRCHGQFMKSPSDEIDPGLVDVCSADRMKNGVNGNKNYILYQIGDSQDYFWIGWNFPFVGYKAFNMGSDSKVRTEDHYLDKLKKLKANKVNDYNVDVGPYKLKGRFGGEHLTFTLCA